MRTTLRNTGVTDKLSHVPRRVASYTEEAKSLGGCVWLLVVVFIVGVIYPPAAAAMVCAVTTAAVLAWILLLLGDRR
jgi:hypothetical protein